MSKEQLKIAGAIMAFIMILSVGRVGSDMLFHHDNVASKTPSFVPDPQAQERPSANEQATPPQEEALPERLKNASIPNGERLARKCKACHSLEKNGAIKIGPPLWSIFGSPVASYFGFNYSDALKDRNIIWSPSELDKFLKDPDSYVPGTKMRFAGLKDGKERADVIAYLRTLTTGSKRR